MSDSDFQHPHEALAKWRAVQDISQAQAGARIGVKGPTWHEYETGGSIPQGGYRIAIEILTGIPADSWMPERERAAIAAARVAVADRKALDTALPGDPAADCAALDDAVGTTGAV